MYDQQQKLKKLHNRKQLNKLLNEYGFSNIQVGTATKRGNMDVHVLSYGMIPAVFLLYRNDFQYFSTVQFKCDYDADYATYHMLDLRLVSGQWVVVECHIGDAVLFTRG